MKKIKACSAQNSTNAVFFLRNFHHRQAEQSAMQRIVTSGEISGKTLRKHCSIFEKSEKMLIFARKKERKRFAEQYKAQKFGAQKS